MVWVGLMGWLLHNVCKSPHKGRSIRVCVCEQKPLVVPNATVYILEELLCCDSPR